MVVGVNWKDLYTLVAWVLSLAPAAFVVFSCGIVMEATVHAHFGVVHDGGLWCAAYFAVGMVVGLQEVQK